MRIEYVLIQITCIHMEYALRRIEGGLHESTSIGGLNVNWLANQDLILHDNAMLVSK